MGSLGKITVFVASEVGLTIDLIDLGLVVAARH